MCYFSPRYPVNTLEMEHGNEFIFKDHRISVIQAIHSIPSLSYRIDEPMRRGRFNRTRASEMGIPEGPLWGNLQRGEEINYQKDGEILRAVPGDVMGPPRKGLSLVYSGDTAPNAELIEMARDADVLIHEATFGRRFSDLASEFGHTTAGDASRIGLEAGVKNLFLFHFSPRYSDPDSFREIEVEAREIFPDANFPDDGDIYEITH
jgi:ribonuclease Z